MIALATAAIGLGTATPAAAALQVTTACDAGTAVASSPTSGATSCAGYYSGNLLNGSPTDLANQTTAISSLLGTTFTVDSTLWSSLNTNGLVVTSLSGGLLTFNQALFGDVVIGVHVGNTGTATTPTLQDQSVFFLFSGLTGQTSIDLAGLTNGFSNAALYQNGSPAPEPATWAMMLLGFGGIGMAMRRNRSRRSRTALMQIA
jgi:hypothetical protein